jgi:GH18 family chitinase
MRLNALLASIAAVSLALAGCNNSSGTGFAGGTGGSDGTGDSTQAPEALSCGKLAPTETVVLGYVPTYRNVEKLGTTLDFDTLTHVAVAFGVPYDAGGGAVEVGFENGIPDQEILDFIAAAHAKGVKVLISIGGAAGSVTVAPFLIGDKVAPFVDAILAFVTKYDFDGVDVDIEGSHVDETYGPFVKALADKIRPEGLLVTAAVARNFASRIDDRTMWCFDFVNIMSYDYAGGWSDPADHSSYSVAQSDLGYWADTRGYPKGRAVLGVPFYGYCWGAEEPCNGDYLVGFDTIMERNPDKSSSDTFVEGTITYWYNGTATLERKAKLGKSYGGVMIWDMGSDTDEQMLFSALKVGLTASE